MTFEQRKWIRECIDRIVRDDIALTDMRGAKSWWETQTGISHAGKPSRIAQLPQLREDDFPEINFVEEARFKPLMDFDGLEYARVYPPRRRPKRPPDMPRDQGWVKYDL
jgi:hypothetical protein